MTPVTTQEPATGIGSDALLAGKVSALASLSQCSVRWFVQKLTDMDIWVDCPQLSSDCKGVAESNMGDVCQSLISEMARHRLVRRVTFDFLEPKR